eukprot:11155018-Ditylum_brightwellii.AAC.1
MTDSKSTTNKDNQNSNDGFETLNDATNDIHCRSERESLQGQPPRQQARHVPQPFDNTLSNHPIFQHPQISELSLPILEREDAVRHKLPYKYMDLQII